MTTIEQEITWINSFFGSSQQIKESELHALAKAIIQLKKDCKRKS